MNGYIVVVCACDVTLVILSIVCVRLCVCVDVLFESLVCAWQPLSGKSPEMEATKMKCAFLWLGLPPK